MPKTRALRTVQGSEGTEEVQRVQGVKRGKRVQSATGPDVFRRADEELHLHKDDREEEGKDDGTDAACIGSRGQQ